MKINTLYSVLLLVVLCSLAQFVQAKASDLQDYSQPADNHAKSSTSFEQAKLNQYSYVDGGTFTMGTSQETGYSEPDEFPSHQVTIYPFYICNHEVTQEEYFRVMQYNPSRFTNGVQLPVERVSWYNAIEYCNRLSIITGMQPCYTYSGYGTNPDTWPHNWNTYIHNNISCNWNAIGYRLPSEAEWEFAARGGVNLDNHTYAGSNDLNEVAWYNGNSSQTHPVMSLQPNLLGIFDMTGNVHEWCWDWYGNYSGAAQNNPCGPETGLFKVRKGGAWDGNYTFQRITNRTYTYIMYGYEGMGFRVIRGAGR